MKLNLYSDMSDGIISKEEYLEFKAGYDRKITTCQKAILRLTEARTQVVHENEQEIPWIQMFRQYENITELHRNVLVNLIEKIVIYDAEHVEVYFRYQDKFRSAMDYISRFEGLR